MITLADEIESKIEVSAGLCDLRERADALLDCAMSLRELEEWDRMMALALQAEQLAVAVDYDLGRARSLGVQGFIQYIRSDFRKALSSCAEALRLAKDDALSQGKLRGVLAMVHWSLGNFEEALRLCEQSREYARTAGDRQSEAFSAVICGGVLQSLGELEQAVAAHLEGLEIFKTDKYPAGIARALSGLGTAYQALGLPDSALECHQQSLDLARSIHFSIGISRSLNDLAESLRLKGDLPGALKLHEEALELRRRAGYRNPEITSLLNLGTCHRQLGDSRLALKYIHDGLKIAEEIEAKPKEAQLHLALAELYESEGELKCALTHFRNYERVKSQLSQDHAATRQKALELQAEVEIIRRDAEIFRLTNVDLHEKNEALARLLDELQRTQSQLINSEKMAALGGLVAAVTHEVNSPLGVIRSSADMAARCAEKLLAAPSTDVEKSARVLKSNAELMQAATRRIETLVSKLKNFAGIDRAEYRLFDPLEALDETVYLLSSELEGRIVVERKYDPVPSFYCFGAEISQVFLHLLKNASEAVDGAGTIQLESAVDDKWFSLKVRDSGKGIDSDHLPLLFRPGFSPHEGRVRASLSLFTCQNVVRKHGGEIDVVSEVGKGAEFCVRLPRNLEFAEHGLPDFTSLTLN